MKVNELRVGNWTNNNVENVKLSKKDLIFLLTNDNEHFANPIPLTEEWLIKFGFEEDDDDYLKSITESLDLQVNIKRNRIVLEGYDGVNFLEIKPQYVHQLQNLFYYLCGEELQIKNR